MSVKLVDKFLKDFVSEEEISSYALAAEDAHHKIVNKTGAGNDFLGWYTLPFDYDKEEFARIKKAAEKIKSNSKALIVIGIGGSYLGARMAVEMLHSSFANHNENGVQIYFAGNSISSSYLADLIEKVKDIDFDNNVVYVNVTKNRKPLLVPINQTMAHILNEYLKYRKYKSKDDFLFCNVFGEQLVKSTCYHMLYEYNKRRGVETTGIHRYRHTFARQWILNGGNVVSLSRLLGHSS